MNRAEIEEMINQSVSSAIKKHEFRVGWISGVIGLVFTFGIIHSIWLMKNLIQ